MSCYWFNREKLLKNKWDEYHNKGGKQKAANQKVLREDETCQKSIETCQKIKK